MNPSDYYKHEVVNKVREPELRKVASVLANHIGQQNALFEQPKPEPWQLQYGGWR